MLERLKRWARALRLDVLAVWLAARDPRVPWYAKALALAVAAYTLSPIDLIPDFIPVFGYLDDLILVPLGLLLVIRLVPVPLMDEFRTRAADRASTPRSLAAATVIMMIWIAGALILMWWLWPAPAGSARVAGAKCLSACG
jgi:uncharacterized membrane protein YkvA (DUF1232 family)